MQNKYRKILLTASTKRELQNLIHLAEEKDGYWQIIIKDTEIHLFVSGIGVPLTMFSLTQHLTSHNYDFLLQIGLAGSFNKSLQNGDLLIVEEDAFADILINDNGDLISLHEVGLNDYNVFPFINNMLVPEIPFLFSKTLPFCRSITVNTTSGSDLMAKQRLDKYECDIESMEGAAFFYVAMMNDIPCIQLRVVSNPVGNRNTKNWDIPLALENLYSFLKRELLP